MISQVFDVKIGERFDFSCLINQQQAANSHIWEAEAENVSHFLTVFASKLIKQVSELELRWLID